MKKHLMLDLKPPNANKCYRHANQGGKSYLYKTKEFDRFKEKLGWKIKEKSEPGELPIEEPIELQIEFGFKQQHRSNEKLEGKPYRDIDNPLKPLLDGLEGILFEDDTQIIALFVQKHVSDEPNMRIEVHTL